MSLTFTPDASPAPPMARVWAHARTEASLILRNGEQAILAIVIPMAVLVGSRILGDTLGLTIEEMAPSVLALVMWSSCLTTLAIGTGFERRYNVLERIAATPLGKPGILLGKGLSIAMITAGQVVLLTVAALALGWRPDFSVGSLTVALLVSLLSMGAFAGLALSISGSLRPEATLAVANLLYLIGMPLGVLVPLDRYPTWVQDVLAWLPTGALGETLRGAATGEVLLLPVVVAALWCVGSLALAWKVFTWTS
ncbi:ABC transporter permease [Tessaracoccus flavus]|uniref:ABC transporter permease n=1 Tax=Tessaracoccus flavus TaxID=1610493 RepID=A0A1Q2CDF0_9ACTN|nr:ABC transporter permease [Tessaracoccus flavus]AQP44134.1 ABC transporter permease [Tessaracoccus flavus]SDY36149.1 ABC-2 type transport system permease protein [Tessaracoccus flavus]